MVRFCPACVVFALFLTTLSLVAAEPELSSPGLPEWEKGQQALLEGRTEQAITAFEQSLKQDPALVRNYLSLAAAYLGQGKEEQAAEQLKQYLDKQPDHYVVRGEFA